MTGLEPREPRERRGELRPLARLACEPDRLVVFGLRRRPLVSGGVVARDAVEKARQHSEGGLRTGVLDRRLDERPTRFGLAEPERAHHEPGQEPRIRLQLRGALGELDAASKCVDPALAVAAEDERHSLCGGGEELGPHRRAGREELACASRGAQHVARRAGEEGGVDRLCEHRDRELGLAVRGLLRSGGEDLVPLHHRPLARGDPPAEVLDPDKPVAARVDGANLVEERHGSLGASRQPGGIRSGEQKPSAPLVVGREPRCPLERCGRHGMRAPLARPRPRLLQRRGGGVLRP